jgi:hypothetical protein
LKLYQRLKLKQTASALKSVPSLNFTPSRRVKVQVRPSALGVHSVARDGTMSVPPAFVVTRPSKIWRIGRIDSPSLTAEPSRIVGSAEAPKTRVPPVAAPPPSPPPDPLSPPQAVRPATSIPVAESASARRVVARRDRLMGCISTSSIVSFAPTGRVGESGH